MRRVVFWLVTLAGLIIGSLFAARRTKPKGKVYKFPLPKSESKEYKKAA